MQQNKVYFVGDETFRNGMYDKGIYTKIPDVLQQIQRAWTAGEVTSAVIGVDYEFEFDGTTYIMPPIGPNWLKNNTWISLLLAHAGATNIKFHDETEVQYEKPINTVTLSLANK